MAEHRGSRRMFVGGAVAGAALLGPLAWMRARRAGTTIAARDGIVVVDGVPTQAPQPVVAGPSDSPEVAGWDRTVGQSYAITGPSGTVSAALGTIERSAPDRSRPAGIRQQSFTLRFALDPRGAPEGDGIYDIVHPSVGSMKAFLQPRAPQMGKAIMVAVFN